VDGAVGRSVRQVHKEIHAYNACFGSINKVSFTERHKKAANQLS